MPSKRRCIHAYLYHYYLFLMYVLSNVPLYVVKWPRKKSQEYENITFLSFAVPLGNSCSILHNNTLLPIKYFQKCDIVLHTYLF